MSRNPRLRHEIFIFMLALSMLTILLLPLNGFWRQTFPHHLIVLLAILGSAGGRMLAASVRAGIFSFLIISVPAAMVAATIGTATHPEVFGRSLGDWVERAAGGELSTMPPPVALFFLTLVAIAGGFAITAEAQGRGSTFWTLTAGLGLFSLQWLLFWPATRLSAALYLTAGLALWSVAAAYRRGRTRVSAADIRGAGWAGAGYGIGLVIVAVALAGLLPPLTPPAQLGFVLKAVRGLKGAAATMIDQPMLTGFGGLAEYLGGPVNPGTGTAFTLQIEPALAGPLYLRGKVYSEYTGHGWRLQSPSAFPAADAPAAVPTIDLARTDADIKITVQPAELLTDTIFHPLGLRAIEGVGRWQIDRVGNITAVDRYRSGDPYQLIGLQSVRSADHRPLKDQAAFLALPDYPATAAIAALARAVTQTQKSDLDKALMLETYLRTHYGYDLAPPAPIANTDFVYNFLFENQAGYCVYHSTAMAVMLRTIGIPSRWVEGFVALPHGQSEIQIEHSQAHAWVEAFISGQGWMTFDPTPRFGLPVSDTSYVSARLPLAPRVLPAPDHPPPGSARPQRRRAGAWLLIALSIGTMVALRRRLQKSIAADTATAVQQLYGYTIRLLNQFGHTAEDIARVSPRLDIALRYLTADYEKARYGPPGALFDPDARRRAIAVRRQTEQTLRVHYNRFRYLWLRLRFSFGPPLANHRRNPNARFIKCE